MREWWILYEKSNFDLRRLLQLLLGKSDEELNSLLLDYVRAWRGIGGDGLDDLCDRMSEDDWDDFRTWLMSEPEETWVIASHDVAEVDRLYRRFDARVVDGRWDLDDDVEIDGRLLRKGRRRLDTNVVLGILVDLRFGGDGVFNYIRDRYYADGSWA